MRLINQSEGVADWAIRHVRMDEKIQDCPQSNED